MHNVGLPRRLSDKESANAEDVGSVPGSRRFPGEGNGNPIQYSCLGNPMDREAYLQFGQGESLSQYMLS